jgi:hypothetical protein
MTKDRFIAIQKKRGYQVEVLGKMVILIHNDYRAFWFFNEDGTLDRTITPTWTVTRPE